mmetsp:Transcript_7347/g.21706  ORF Transcript_7347/g.21706 Transcript_7347/m.21706 type:complete len:267 (-) Transcript_7347:2337-3137(-)
MDESVRSLMSIVLSRSSASTRENFVVVLRGHLLYPARSYRAKPASLLSLTCNARASHPHAAASCSTCCSRRMARPFLRACFVTARLLQYATRSRSSSRPFQEIVLGRYSPKVSTSTAPSSPAAATSTPSPSVYGPGSTFFQNPQYAHRPRHCHCATVRAAEVPSLCVTASTRPAVPSVPHVCCPAPPLLPSPPVALPLPLPLPPRVLPGGGSSGDGQYTRAEGPQATRHMWRAAPFDCFALRLFELIATTRSRRTNSCMAPGGSLG